VVFFGRDPAGFGLFASDGSAIRRLTSLPAFGPWQAALARLGTRVLALVRHQGTGAAFHSDLWVTDGTAIGTAQIASQVAAEAYPSVAVFDDRVWFIADDPVQGTELFASDGSVAGTGQVGELAAGPVSYGTPVLMRANTRMFLVAGGRIWTIDDRRTGPVAVPMPVPLQPAQFLLPSATLDDLLLFG